MSSDEHFWALLSTLFDIDWVSSQSPFKTEYVCMYVAALDICTNIGSMWFCLRHDKIYQVNGKNIFKDVLFLEYTQSLQSLCRS